MKAYQSLSHTRWDCKYHIVFIPKKRRKKIFGMLRQHLGEIFHELARHQEAKIVEGHLISPLKVPQTTCDGLPTIWRSLDGGASDQTGAGESAS